MAYPQTAASQAVLTLLPAANQRQSLVICIYACLRKILYLLLLLQITNNTCTNLCHNIVQSQLMS